MSKTLKKSSRRKKTKVEIPPEELSGSGKFHCGENIQYIGEWKIVTITEKKKKKESGRRKKDDNVIEKVKMRDGKGKYIDGNNVYEGEFQNDKFNGKGKMIFHTGDSYEGDFLDNMFHGEGTFVWKDNSRYFGPFVKNRMHGKGIYVTSEGERYHGEFYNGVGESLRREVEV